MKKMAKRIQKLNMKYKVLCCVLVLAMVAGAVLYGMKSLDADAETAQTLADKTYLSDIVDRIAEGKQKYFTILEITPDESMGEYKYYVGSPEVETGILSKDNTALEKLYNQIGGTGRANEWISISKYFSNFGYSMKYNSYQKKYELKCEQYFNNQLLIEPYRSLLEGKIQVNTVEANDLTEQDIINADLIVITATAFDSNTLAAYNFYTGNVDANGDATKSTGVYYKDGENFVECSTDNPNKLTYDTYELVEGEYVSRDISWEMARKLLDYMYVGRDLKGTGTYSQTPVIFSGLLTEGNISQSSNMYKLSLIYRMLTSEQYTSFVNNYLTGVDAEGNPFLTTTGIQTVALCYEGQAETTVTETTTTAETTTTETTTAETTTTETTTTETGETSEGEGDDEEENDTPDETTTQETTTQETTTLPSITKLFINEFTSQDILAHTNIVADECIDSNPNAKKRVTNNYWVHNNEARMIPANLTLTVKEDTYAGLSERGLKNKTVAEVVRYLLGCKNSYEIKYNYGKIRILEVEPCWSFRYNTFAETVALAQKMQIDTTGWTASNYKNYMQIDCVSTKTLNALTTDLISTYDVIIIGDCYTQLTQNSSGKTLYNDSKLDGYVYLAYGDLTKIPTVLLGNLPSDYIKYTGGKITASGQLDKLKNGNNDSGIRVIYDITQLNGSARYEGKYTAGTSAFGDNQQGHHQLKYAYVYAVDESTKHMWNDAQQEFIFANYNEGDIVGLKSTKSYLSGKNNMTDMFAEQVGNARMSGNDITAKTMEKLKDYADSGKLMVFADWVYENDGTKIYPTSHMAELMNYVRSASTRANYMRESNLAGFITHINAMSPDLTISVKPDDLTYSNKTISGVSTPMANLPAVGDYDHKLRFSFAIDGYANSKYKVKLIIDKNGDGVFADEGYIVTDDTNEIFKTQIYTTDANGHKDVNNFNVELSDDDNGLIAYKIEIAQLIDGVESTLRTSYIGYTTVRSEETQAVKVLQILPYSQYAANTANPTLNTTTSGGKFQQFMSQISYATTGYTITIDTMYAYQFEEQFECDCDDPDCDTTCNMYVRGESYNTDKNYLIAEDYKMVIIGFGDSYLCDDVSNAFGATDCLRDYMENGNSVMFSHDNMNVVATTNTFNITKDGKNATSINTDDYKFDNGKRVPGEKFCLDLTVHLRAATGMDRYGITLTEAERMQKEIPTYAEGKQPAYTTMSSDGKYYVEELQGFSDFTLWRSGYISSYRNNASNSGVYIIRPYAYGFGGVNSGSNSYLTNGTDCMWTTGSVQKVNTGQVTMFPYKLNDTLSIAATHGQYYQLDMEDKELVVWYTLASSSGYYKETERDGQNNYYIYSKGNVSYTGAGHSSINTNDEAKLFINTIIKTIDAGNSKPKVNVTNGAVGTGGVYNVYATVGEPYKVVFKAIDQDLATLETADNDINYVGVFEKGRVIWDQNGNGTYDEGVDIILDQYARNGVKLYNDYSYTIDVKHHPQLQGTGIQGIIESQIATTGTYFIIEAEDMYGEVGTARVCLTTRDLFRID